MAKKLKRKTKFQVLVTYLASAHVGSIHGPKGVDAKIRKAAAKKDSSAKTNSRNQRTLKFIFTSKAAAEQAAKKIRKLVKIPPRGWDYIAIRKVKVSKAD